MHAPAARDYCAAFFADPIRTNSCVPGKQNGDLLDSDNTLKVNTLIKIKSVFEIEWDRCQAHAIGACQAKARSQALIAPI
jgi:hypothetical protein